MLLISLASPTQWGAPSFAPLAKGGSRKRRHQVGSITCAQQNHIAQAAWPPTLAKNARMGHPRRERCTQRSIKGGPPAKDGAPSVEWCKEKSRKVGHPPTARVVPLSV